MATPGSQDKPLTLLGHKRSISLNDRNGTRLHHDQFVHRERPVGVATHGGAPVDAGILERHAAFRAATVNPVVLTAVGQCVGHPFMPVNDTVVIKVPHGGPAVVWHQDPPYSRSNPRAATFGVPDFVCDIYLDETTVENGCVHGCPDGTSSVMSITLIGRTMNCSPCPDAVALEVEPGDALFHATSVPHRIAMGRELTTPTRCDA